MRRTVGLVAVGMAGGVVGTLIAEYVAVITIVRRRLGG